MLAMEDKTATTSEQQQQKSTAKTPVKAKEHDIHGENFREICCQLYIPFS